MTHGPWPWTGPETGCHEKDDLLRCVRQDPVDPEKNRTIWATKMPLWKAFTIEEPFTILHSEFLFLIRAWAQGAGRRRGTRSLTCRCRPPKKQIATLTQRHDMRILGQFVVFLN